MSKFGNASKRFITVTQTTTVMQALCKNLPKDPLVPLTSGGVWLGKERVIDPHKELLKGQTLTVYTATTQGKKYTLPQACIHTEAKDWVAIIKPAALSIGADRSNVYENLTYGVEAWYRTKNIRYTPSPIMRLDFMVQGLVLYAKHKTAEKTLFHLTQTRKIGKLYTAILEPQENPPRYLRIKDHLGFTNKAVPDPNGKPAHSLFIYKGRLPQGDMYSVILLTGRRHQIRYHAAKYLRPIVGDDWYGAKKTPHQALSLAATGINFFYDNQKIRLRLSPAQLDFLDPTPGVPSSMG